MRVFVAMSVLAISVMSCAAANADTFDDVLSACVAKWPSDYQMQKYCLDKERKAADDLKGISIIAPPPFQKILTDCYAKWSSSADSMFSMTKYCYETQTKAYEQLYGEPPQLKAKNGTVLGTCQFDGMPPMKTLSGGSYGYRLQIGNDTPVDLNLAGSFQSATVGGKEYFFDETEDGRSRLTVSDPATKREKIHIGHCH